MQATEMFWPWLLATLVFLVLLGSGRTLRGHRLGHPPFGAGVALSVALGVMLYSLLWMGIGHFGGLRSPVASVVLLLGVLLALPGLLWTWNDYRSPPPGLERGFGPRWFAGGAWFLLIAALLISFGWISGVLAYGGLGFVFERPGLDWAVGRVVYDPAFPRDAFLGDDPLALWLYGLEPLASLALAWWLGVAILFGVCGLGWRLHAHGAGLAAAALLAIVLFASNQPLFLAPALPAAVALVAVMILAVESRGRPHLGRTITAGALGGFALISDLGAGAMLLPLLLFGPTWCKIAGRNGDGHGVDGDPGTPDLDERVAELETTTVRARYDYQEEGGAGHAEVETTTYRGREYFGRRYDEDDYVDDKGFEDGDKILGMKKFLTPARHTAWGLLGFSLVATPWALRNEDWTDDWAYGLRAGYEISTDYRYYDHDLDQPGHQPSFEIRPGDRIDLKADWSRPYPRIGLDALHLDYEPDYGVGFLDDWDFFDGYLDATELGLGLGVLALLSPLYGWRRRDPFFYVAPAALGYGASYYLGDGQTVTPSSLALFSVAAGSSLYTMRGCGGTGRGLVFGGTLATGSLAIGLSGAYDCGYWDDWRYYGYFPQFEFRYQPEEPEEPQEEQDPGEERDRWDVGVGYTYEDDWGMKARLGYKWPQLQLGYTFDDGGERDPEEGGAEGHPIRDPELRAGLRYDYQWRSGFQLRGDYGYGQAEEEESDTPKVPGRLDFGTAPGYDLPDEGDDDDAAEEDTGIGVQPRFSEPGPTVRPPPEEEPQKPPAERPRIPTYKPDVRPDPGLRVPKQPGYPTQKPTTKPGYP